MFYDSIILCNLIYSKKAGSHLLVSSLYTRGKGCSCESLRRNLHLSTHICIGAIRKKVLVAQSCLTLCPPMDCSPPGSSVHGILQARILEWLPFPSPVDLPNTRIEPRSPALQTDSLPSEPSRNPPLGRKEVIKMKVIKNI